MKVTKLCLEALLFVAVSMSADATRNEKSHLRHLFDCDASVTVTVKTDLYPKETSWKLTNQDGGMELMGGNYFKKEQPHHYSKDLCVGQCYDFIIKDSADDGLCCSYGEGYASIKVNGEEIYRADEFSDEAEKTFCIEDGEVPECDEVYLGVDVFFDDYPEETSWELLDEDGNILMEGDYHEDLDSDDAMDPPSDAPTCVAQSCTPGCRGQQYQFIIYDSYGDGICCSYGNGDYTVFSNGDVVVHGDGNFDSEKSHWFSA